MCRKVLCAKVGTSKEIPYVAQRLEKQYRKLLGKEVVVILDSFSINDDGPNTVMIFPKDAVVCVDVDMLVKTTELSKALRGAKVSHGMKVAKQKRKSLE